MYSNPILNQIEIWIDCSDMVMDPAYYCQNLKINKDKVVLCSNPSSSQKFCLTEDSFYHYSCGIWNEIKLISISDIVYNNGVIRINPNLGEYTVSALAPNMDQSREDEIGNAIAYVMRYFKQNNYGKNNLEQVS